MRAEIRFKKELSRKYKSLWMKLIGSKARGDFDKESDIDIVIVLKNVDWDIERDIYEKGINHWYYRPRRLLSS